MREYIKPIIYDEDIELEDIIAVSGEEGALDTANENDPTGWGGLSD